ncbi:hypothetical protein CLU79DRAFT_761931 [Phycomyces nitens]|nr:hypothetical protein CLU79DRAFT_761931 [Phycomyces nitens]
MEAQKRAIYHMQQSQNATKILETIKTEYIQQTEKLHDHLNTIQNERDELKKQLRNTQYNQGSTERMLRNQVETTMTRANLLENTVKALTERLHSQEQAIIEGSKREQDLLSKLNQVQNHEMHPVENSNTETLLREELQYHTTRSSQLADENERLRNDRDHYKRIYTSNASLQEENRSLEKQVSKIAQIEETNVRLEIENARFKQERIEWIGYLGSQDSPDYQTPKEITRMIAKERISVRETKAQVQYLEAALKKKNDIVPRLETYANDVKAAIIEKDRRHDDDQIAMAMLEKSREAVQRQVRLLEQHLTMYESAETSVYDEIKVQRMAQLQELVAEYQNIINQQTHELIQLKSTLSQVQLTSSAPAPGPYCGLVSGQTLADYIDSFNNDTVKLQHELSETLVEKSVIQKDISVLKEQVEMLAKVVQRRGLDRGESIQIVIGSNPSNDSSESPVEKQQDVDLSLANPLHDESGEACPVENSKENQISQDASNETQNNPKSIDSEHFSEYNIMELKENPTALCQAARQKELNSLREEILALRKQLEEKEEQSSFEHVVKKRKIEDGAEVDIHNSTVNIPKVSLDNLNTDISNLQQEIAKKDKRILRLNQVFEAKVLQHNNAVKSLLGYNIEFRNGQVLLESVEVDGSKLAFIMEPRDGEEQVHIIGSDRDDYMSLLQPIYENYMIQKKHTPGFFSAVTLELIYR